MAYRVSKWVLTVLGVSCLGGALESRAAPLAGAEMFDAQRLDQIQVIGTHNSYHTPVDNDILQDIERRNKNLSDLLAYNHAPLTQQLESGVRQIELDIYADTAGGRFTHPHLTPFSEVKKLPRLSASDRKLMQAPGFKVMHIPDLDQRATCQPFVQCLKEIQTWSREHPTHVPLFVLLETVQQNDVAGLQTPEPFTARTLDQLDQTIRSVFTEQELLVPDQVRRNQPTLRGAVAAFGWPTVGASRGKIVFLLDQQNIRKDYLSGHPSLHNRVAFTNAPADADDAAFIELNEGPASKVAELVKKHFLVRSRTDADTQEGRSGATQRRDTLMASGAQLLSTDYPASEPAVWSGYYAAFLNGLPAQCNPVSATKTCSSSQVEASLPASLHLDRIVMVMRHGIRSPLEGQVPDQVGLAGGWPEWVGQFGDLTEHGRKALTLLGASNRQWLQNVGLLSANVCPAPQSLDFHANSSRRTIASAQAYLAGFSPECSVTVTHKPVGTPDPLFAPLEAAPHLADMRKIVPLLSVDPQNSPQNQQALDYLSQNLICHKEACAFLTAPNRVVAHQDGLGFELSGPIKQGSSIAEAMMLAYVDGKPLLRGQKGEITPLWLEQLSGLHAAMLNAIARPPAIGLVLSSVLRPAIWHTLEQEKGPVFSLYFAHDDTIAPLLGILNVHVHVPGYAQDEVPVGSALAFALYTDPATHEKHIKTFFQSQSAEGLRTLSPLPPTVSPLVLSGCQSTGQQSACQLEEFKTIFLPTP